MVTSTWRSYRGVENEYNLTFACMIDAVRSILFRFLFIMDFSVIMNSISTTCVLLMSLIRFVQSYHSFSQYKVYRRADLALSVSLCATLIILASLSWSKADMHWTPILSDLAAGFPPAQIVSRDLDPNFQIHNAQWLWSPTHSQQFLRIYFFQRCVCGVPQQIVTLYVLFAVCSGLAKITAAVTGTFLAPQLHLAVLFLLVADYLGAACWYWWQTKHNPPDSRVRAHVQSISYYVSVMAVVWLVIASLAAFLGTWLVLQQACLRIHLVRAPIIHC